MHDGVSLRKHLTALRVESLASAMDATARNEAQHKCIRSSLHFVDCGRARGGRGERTGEDASAAH